MRLFVTLGVLLTLAQPGMAWAKPKSKAVPHAQHKTQTTAKPAASKHAPPQTGSKEAQALRLAADDKWPQARQIAESSGNPLAVKLVRWLDDSRPNSGASFKEISELWTENPNWPQRAILQRRAEEAISLATSSDDILAWFDINKPITADGGMAYGAALLSTGREAEAKDILRQTWIDENFGALQERTFLSKYRDLLTDEDHRARMKRLLWDGQTSSAERMMLNVDSDTRHLAHARLALMKGKSTPAQVLESLPEKLRSDPGVIFECVRWYRRKDMNEDAIRLLKQPPDDLERPGPWWDERSIVARRALQMGYISEAYNIASKHKQTDGPDYAEAEWLAGWIALRFLNEPESALKHFKQMADKALSSHGKARAAYWQGRAAGTLGKADEASALFKQAAGFATSYYGQLASEKLGAEQGWILPPDPKPTDDEKKRFAANELARAVDLMAEAQTPVLARPFLLRLLEDAQTPEQKALVIAKADKLGRIEMTVHLARKADRAGVTLPESGWPLPGYAFPDDGPEKALVLALMRQESGFHAGAVSSAGARGLMQLMPATAKGVAKGLKIKYAPSNLTNDPNFNIRLGTTYLSGLLDDFKGSYIMALAAYNAGPHRVTKWVRDFGDPRDPEVDAVDWVEMIPFSETRGYVKRVMESVQVYRKRLGVESSTLALLLDLKRKQD